MEISKHYRSGIFFLSLSQKEGASAVLDCQEHLFYVQTWQLWATVEADNWVLGTRDRRHICARIVPVLRLGETAQMQNSMACLLPSWSCPVLGALFPGQTPLDLLDLRITQLGGQHDGVTVWSRWCERDVCGLSLGGGEPIENSKRDCTSCSTVATKCLIRFLKRQLTFGQVMPG